ncbi:hypothetical protein [Paenibacillus alkalitolerans]|uniref:hypothetical protein n=1 Tax=Paenibacillus alkalitolerans TaxID=2799335 RepID=UPI0018F54B44|nr:hypothetical protein [Paenibacillus alkalitolerans]
MSLKLDRFPIPFPPGQYLVCRALTISDPMVTTEPAGTDMHSHQVKPPTQLKALEVGDRVLVAWVNGGTDPVIIDVVVT